MKHQTVTAIDKNALIQVIQAIVSRAMATGTKLQRDLLAADIITGPPVYVRRQVYYTGHATTTYSVEQASTIIDFIGSKTGCDHCLPFAVRLVEAGEMIFIAEGTWIRNQGVSLFILTFSNDLTTCLMLQTTASSLAGRF
jgi:hypothetical protein